MMTGELSLLLVFGAGLTSVASPCVLPVVPLILGGTTRDDRHRPLLVVAGLATSFIAMGIASTLLGGVIGSAMYKVERVIGVVIAVLGLLLALDRNPFERLGFLSRLGASEGRMHGYLSGLMLGVVWIPCVGPMLSAVLAYVATQRAVVGGVGYLLVYSAGFAVPMLLLAYASQGVRQRVRAVAGKGRAVSFVSGALLVALGIFIATNGMVAFSRLVT